MNAADNTKETFDMVCKILPKKDGKIWDAAEALNKATIYLCDAIIEEAEEMEKSK